MLTTVVDAQASPGGKTRRRSIHAVVTTPGGSRRCREQQYDYELTPAGEQLGSSRKKRMNRNSGRHKRALRLLDNSAHEEFCKRDRDRKHVHPDASLPQCPVDRQHCCVARRRPNCSRRMRSRAAGAYASAGTATSARGSQQTTSHPRTSGAIPMAASARRGTVACARPCFTACVRCGRARQHWRETR